MEFDKINYISMVLEYPSNTYLKIEQTQRPQNLSYDR